MRPLIALLVTAAAAVAAVVAATSPAATRPVIAVYPSSTVIPPSGPLPAKGAAGVALASPRGGRQDGMLVVSGAKKVAASVDRGNLGPMEVRLFFAHFVKVGSRLVPDALVPWDGSLQPTERPNQPIWVQVAVPNGMRAGAFRGTVVVTADAIPIAVPLAVRVFPVELPPPGAARGNLLSSFNVGGESYVNKAEVLYRFRTNDERIAANTSFYTFLANERISPGSWGFGEPKSPSGNAESTRWWLDSAGNMARVATAGPGFSALRIPISNNRTAPHNFIGGIDPSKPETWCGYLTQVRSFWQQHGLVGPSKVAYLYGQDEPGPSGQQLVGRQAAVAHRCFPGSKVLMTGNPLQGANDFLFDGKGGDDVDIWTVASYRYYGSFTVPAQQKAGKSRERQLEQSIATARKRGKQIWGYTYAGVPGTPGVDATVPLFEPRMWVLWNALEGNDGILYFQGTTTYGPGNPFDSLPSDGRTVFVYPGKETPYPSARLEQIRLGIEDAAILDIVRRERGAGAVRSVLGQNGLFSADADGVKLGCILGCELKTDTKYSWPKWSQDATTPAKIEEAHLQALQLASG